MKRFLPLVFALLKFVSGYFLISSAYYGQASAINYYNRHRALPLANSLNGSFLFWFPPLSQCRALILVDDEPDDELAPHFAAYRRLGTVTNPCVREWGTHITIGIEPDGFIKKLVRQERRDALRQWQGNDYNPE